MEKLPRAIPLYFGVYLVFWSFLVAGTLISYTGLAANTILPLPLEDRWGTLVWGAIQSLLTVGLIRWGGFRAVEKLMRFFIGLMLGYEISESIGPYGEPIIIFICSITAASAGVLVVLPAYIPVIVLASRLKR